MEGEVIKSFLVGLGFGIDEASLSKFNKSIASATLRVTALYTATQVAAAGIVAGISKISEGFEQMGYEYRIIAPAINKALVLRRELLKAYAAAGINITKVIQASVKLNLSLTKTRFAFEAIYKSVASRFFDLVTKQSDIFRQKIYANMPKIQEILERFVKIVFRALEATIQLGVRLWSILGRVYDFFVQLDHATDGWSTIILGVIAAWKLLNLSFLATPLGLIITGLVAILALFDDFKTFQEGGTSFFNWGPVVPIINEVTAALQILWGVLKQIGTAIDFVLLGFIQLIQGDFTGLFESFAAAGDVLLATLKPIWEALKGIGSAFLGLGNLIGDKLGLPNIGANLAAGLTGSVSPVGGDVQNNNRQTNQNVNQQTNINITESANAKASGDAVQNGVSNANSDLYRYLTGRAQ